MRNFVEFEGKLILPCSDLSQAEVRVFNLVMAFPYMTRKEMAEKVNISPHTIKFHLTNIYKKEGLKNKPELVKKYMVRDSDEVVVETKPIPRNVLPFKKNTDKKLRYPDS